MRYLIVDTSHLVNRAVHVIKAPPGSEEWIGQALSIVFQSLRRHYERFNIDHCVMCFDSYSWREAIYETYKDNRTLDPTADSDRIKAKIAAKKITHRVLDELIQFLRDETNVTVLHAPGAEADDFVARWVQRFPDDIHVIISGDSDLRQLVAKNVDLYDTTLNVLYTTEGIMFQDGKKVGPKDTVTYAYRHERTWKVKLDTHGQPVPFDPKWELFVKLIRGDRRDNIKPAYPRVSDMKMREAYEDRGGAKWNNLINAMAGRPPRLVREVYELNRTLIDLTAQPDTVISTMDAAIDAQVVEPAKTMVQVNFDKFCQRFKLNKVGESSVHLVPLLASPVR